MSANKQKKLSRMEIRLNTPKEKREPLGKKNKNNFWTDLLKHYNLAKSLSSRIFNEQTDSIKYLTNDIYRYSLIKDKAEFKNICDSILNDISEYVSKVDKIYDMHKEFKGSAVETDESLQAINLINLYLEYSEIFKDNIIKKSRKIKNIIKQVDLFCYNQSINQGETQ